MPRRKPNKSKARKPAAARKRRWGYVLLSLMLMGSVALGLWFVWIDHQVRRDFEALQWALPGRIYTRPLELHEGAHLGQAELLHYLQQLGYREVESIRTAGEYTRSGSSVQLFARGFQFWDGVETARFIDVEFDGRFVTGLRGEQGRMLALARLEPVEIAQINPDTGEDRLPLSRDEVPEALVKALVAVEDQRFYSHYGVDPVGIGRALVANIRMGGISQGGSTLTQQLVKNLYLTRERTLRRKAEEAVMAVALELHFSKDEILTAYLNEVFLGQDGNRAIHGFALAARHYFSRPLQELSLDELALLAALPRGASYYNPLRYPERALARRDVVLSRMRELDFITAAEFDKARAAPLQVVQGKTPANRRNYPAFLELVYRDLARYYDRNALRTEGLRIFTTLDINVQDTLEATLDQSVAAVERSTGGPAAPLEAAVVISSASSGEIRALAGSRKRGYTGFNRALKAVRPIGSLVKPAVYLAALETRDFHLATVLADDPVALKQPNGTIWEPQNYDKTTDGDVYLYDALQRSLNLATVDLGMKLGLHRVTAMISRLGYSKPIQPYPSLLLGAIDMAPLEVAQMYQTIASSGFRSNLRSVEAVTSADGKPLEYYGLDSEQVVDPASVFLLEHTLQGVFERGTARSVAGRMGRHLPLVGKTGSTNDLRDSWFAGYGEDLLGVVWLGYDDNRESGLTGATGALRVWSDFMTALDIQGRQTQAPHDIVWEQVARVPVRDAARRECTWTDNLPFRSDRLQDLGWSCEVNDSFFQRVMERFR
jgi:penicillin-binding protein 1B